jgi:fucose permease
VAAAFLGSVLLLWNPASVVNVLAVALIGFAIAPIFPAMTSGTSQRVGTHYAANTIGLQMAASGLGTAIIPSLLGVLARQFSLEIVPLCLVVVYMGLFGLYMLATRSDGLFNKSFLTTDERR